MVSPRPKDFVLLMPRLEAFSGVRVLTYALMSNHFHLLCQVPEPRELSELELVERIEAGLRPGAPPSPRDLSPFFPFLIKKTLRWHSR